MASYLVTGSTRGIGLALVSHLASLPKSEVGTIFATGRRSNSPELTELVDKNPARVIFTKLDTTDQSSVEGAARAVEEKLHGKGLDVLINNAGIMGKAGRGLEEMDELDEVLKTNVTAPHITTRAFLPLLRRGQKKVVNLSSPLGSISLTPTFQSVPCPAYKISKAAANMLTAQYAQDYAKEGFAIFAVSPGWLKTDMGGPRADLSIDTGVSSVIDIVRKSGTEQNGKFLNIHVPGMEKTERLNDYDGEEIPW